MLCGLGSYLYLEQRWCGDGGGGGAEVPSICRDNLLHLACEEANSEIHDMYLQTHDRLCHMFACKACCVKP
jgi:hypothetical protein